MQDRLYPAAPPLSWINALLLSQRNEQAEAAKRGLLDLQRQKSIKRERGGRKGGAAKIRARRFDVCVCAL